MVELIKTITNTRNFLTSLRTLLCASLILGAASAHAVQMIRYKDDNGNVVLSTTIPADRVKYGYDIVDRYGTLIERIPPQLSPEAYQAKLERERRVRECEKIQNRVRKLYQFESDIDYAEQKGLKSIDQSIANIRANLQVASTQREEFESTAAQLDIAGQPIPNALLDNIARAKSQEQNLTSEIEKRFGEKLELRKTHAYDRMVFGMDSCENGLPDVPLENVAEDKEADAVEVGAEETAGYASKTALANTSH